MRYTKRLLSAGAVLLGAALVLTGCSGGDAGGDAGGGDTGGGDDSFVVGYAGAVQANPNNKAIEDALRVSVEDNGGELIVTDANFDPSKQFSDVQSLINQGIDVLVIWPLDPLSIQPAIQQADEAGIPVLVQDTTEGGPYASNFQVTNYESGDAASALIEETVGPNANVAQIEGLPSVGVLDARNRGFADGAAERGQTILASQINELDSADGARPIVDAWKSRFGSEIQAIFAYNDPSAIGAASAKSDDFDPVIIGMNGDSDGVAAVKDGRLLATFDFHPVQVGATLGWGAHQLFLGEKLPETVILEATMITAENADEWTPVADMLQKKFDISIVEDGGVSKFDVQVRG
ncbi:MAG: sugar ABC transporter substrate-binding protein [Candidatus Leucobacter sulfamidivorax]|nr:sugar ABC transporter substrate-binding protein [Candidatus Leucobacter sulfamidivorax]